MINRESMSSLVTLATGAELVRHITTAVIGDEISDTVDGSRLNRNTLLNLAQVKFQSRLSKHLEK